MKDRLINNFIMKDEFNKNLLMEEYSINEIINNNTNCMYNSFRNFFFTMGVIKKEETYGRTPSMLNMLPKVAYSECQEVDPDNDYVVYNVRMGGAWVRPFLQMYCGLCPQEDGWGNFLSQYAPP